MDYESNKSYIEMRSAGMSVASLVMGILGLALSCCVYPAIIFGSLAIIFALLSRGGEMQMNSYGKAGLVLGIIGMAVGVIFIFYSLMTILTQFGGFDGYINYIEDIMKDMGYYDYSSPYDML